MADKTKPENRIAIVMPTFDRGWCIERAIKSVEQQTCDQWELVIVDDGSTDNTQKVVSRYLADKRIRYFKKENGGVGSARNLGIQMISNHFVTFLDSDDEFVPHAIEQMIEDLPMFGPGNISMILYLAKKNEVEAYRDDRFSDKEMISYQSAVSGRWPNVETAQLHRKEILTKYGFPTIPGGLEAILMHKILKYDGPALIRNKIARIYHTEHSSRLTGVSGIESRALAMPKLYGMFLKEFEEDYRIQNPKQLAYFYLEKGVFEIVSGDVRIGRGSVIKATKFNKGKLAIAACILCASILPRTWFIKLAQLGHTFKSYIS